VKGRLLEVCPFCSGQAVTDDKAIDIGSGDFRYVFGVKCSNDRCFVKPSLYVGGESGYRHGDKLTNEQAKRLSRDKWNIRF
jgi:hypothetical protein